MLTIYVIQVQKLNQWQNIEGRTNDFAAWFHNTASKQTPLLPNNTPLCSSTP